jgi:hypothetical protein
MYVFPIVMTVKDLMVCTDFVICLHCRYIGAGGVRYIVIGDIMRNIFSEQKKKNYKRRLTVTISLVDF